MHSEARVTLLTRNLPHLCNISAAFSLISAATTCFRQSGRHTGHIRGAQWYQPSQPPANCGDSAASRLLPARHFSGSMAQIAIKKAALQPPSFQSEISLNASSNSHPRRHRSSTGHHPPTDKVWGMSRRSEYIHEPSPVLPSVFPKP